MFPKLHPLMMSPPIVFADERLRSSPKCEKGVACNLPVGSVDVGDVENAGTRSAIVIVPGMLAQSEGIFENSEAGPTATGASQ